MIVWCSSPTCAAHVHIRHDENVEDVLRVAAWRILWARPLRARCRRCVKELDDG